MSKHKGNVVDPFATIEKYGADPVRWYLIATSSPSTPTKFDESALGEVVRKHFDTLRNTYSFFALYANTDDVASRAKADKMSIADWLEKKAGPRTIFDRWIESKLNSLVADVTRQLDAYDITRPVRAIQNFVIEELSNWYVRLNRRRFWGSGDDPDKFRAYATLHHALETVCRLSAPVAPITSELFWRELQGYESNDSYSIHSSEYPVADNSNVDLHLEAAMKEIQELTTLGRAIRNQASSKIRQPQSEAYFISPISGSRGEKEFEKPYSYLMEFTRTLAEELNVKVVKFDTEDFIAKNSFVKWKLNHSTAGPKFGTLVKELKPLVENMNPSDAETFYKTGAIELSTSAGIKVPITRNYATPTLYGKGTYVAQAAGNFKAMINVEETPALRAEGFAREIINKIQTMRKAAGFEVVDQIEIKLDVGETLRHALTAHEGFIKKETLATSMIFESLPKPEKTETGNPAAWDVNGESAVIQVTRVNS